MLSLTKGEKIAEIIEPRCDHCIIRVTEDDGPAEIATDVPEELITNEFCKKNGLTPAETSRMREAIKRGKKDLLFNGTNAKSRKDILEQCYENAWEFIGDELKRNIIFPTVGSKIIFTPPQDGWLGHIFVSGPTGAGKSYFINDLVKRLGVGVRLPVHVFTPLVDGDYKEIKDVVGWAVDEGLIDQPMSLEELAVVKPEAEFKVRAGSMLKPEDYSRVIIIFDDLESIRHKQVREQLQQFRDTVLQAGRHYNIAAIVVYHEPMMGFETKKIINECKYFVCFPRSAPQIVRKFLETKVGCDKATRDRCINLPTRALIIKKNHPITFIYDHGVFMLS